MGDIDFQAREFAYKKHADQTATAPVRHQVVVVGAGPVGLTTALDLARQGVHVVVLDDDCRLSTGSRAICFSKRTLEIWDRLGVGQRMIDKGVLPKGTQLSPPAIFGCPRRMHPGTRRSRRIDRECM